VTTPRLSLVATQAAITYSFRAAAGNFGWACCTVNDATGELLITSDWGNWSHRWDPRPSCLGAPNLTAFIGTRGDVDYLARKLQREGRAGRRWSAAATATELRRRLCERRLEHGREQIEGRLDPEDRPGDMPLQHLMEPVGRYTADGLPIYSHRMPAEHRAGRPWKLNGEMYEPLPFLTRAEARRIWRELSELAEECEGSADLFYERVQQIDGFTDYVTEEPWEYGATEQTPEDRALREIVLPALITVCRARGAAPGHDLSTPDATQQARPAEEVLMTDRGVAREGDR
jgi:hypothetical protein